MSGLEVVAHSSILTLVNAQSHSYIPTIVNAQSHSWVLTIVNAPCWWYMYCSWPGC
jgi:hypothetical protein